GKSEENLRLSHEPRLSDEPAWIATSFAKPSSCHSPCHWLSRTRARESVPCPNMEKTPTVRCRMPGAVIPLFICTPSCGPSDRRTSPAPFGGLLGHLGPFRAFLAPPLSSSPPRRRIESS